MTILFVYVCCAFLNLSYEPNTQILRGILLSNKNILTILRRFISEHSMAWFTRDIPTHHNNS